MLYTCRKEHVFLNRIRIFNTFSPGHTATRIPMHHSSSALSNPLTSPNYCMSAILGIFSSRLYNAIWRLSWFLSFTCPDHLISLFVKLSCSVSYIPMCSATILCISTLGVRAYGVIHPQLSSVAIVFKCQDAILQKCDEAP